MVHSLVMGCATAARGAALEPALQAVAFGWAENLMQAAVRSVPLGQTAGQRLLAQLVQAIPAAVQRAMAAPEPIAFAPMLGIHAARPRNPVFETLSIMSPAPLHAVPGRTKKLPPLRVGVGGPVGSGKTTLVEMLCKTMRERWDLIVVTNDIYTKEDQRLLTVAGALPGRAHHGCGDRWLPAHGDPRRLLHQPRSG